MFDVRVRANGGLESTMRTRFVVWAAGEFQYPRERPGKIWVINFKTIDF